MLFLGIGFQLADINSPSIDYWEDSASYSSCFSLPTCGKCTNNPDCGYCFLELGEGAAGAVNGSCVPVSDASEHYSEAGRCTEANMTLASEDLLFASDYCPSDTGNDH